MSVTPFALSLTGITKRFDTSLVLDDVGFGVRAGTVHALLGENGAGKTTLMRIAFGLVHPDRGHISIAGTPVTIDSPAKAIAHNIGMVHQHFSNVGRMTVAENVALGGHGRFDPAAARRLVHDVATSAGLKLEPGALAEDLSVGAQQRLEIVKALARGARLLILDEPTAVLAPAETQALLRWLRGFADTGGAVVLITHKLGEALRVADDVTVLRRGRVAFVGTAAAVTADQLATAMVGDAAPVVVARPRTGREGVIVEAEHLTLANERGGMALTDASFHVHAGEVVGIAAVEGPAQRELVRALAGRSRPISGVLQLPANIGFVPGDRQRDALVLDFSLAENVALRGAGSNRGRMRWRAIRHRVGDLLRAYDVRGGNVDAPARTLSGGNQQKLVMARELDVSPALIVADNPTRGLDILATAAVSDSLRRAAEGGAAVIVYSSDLDEVIALANRMFVLHGSRFSETPVDRDLVGRAMLGLA